MKSPFSSLWSNDVLLRLSGPRGVPEVTLLTTILRTRKEAEKTMIGIMSGRSYLQSQGIRRKQPNPPPSWCHKKTPLTDLSSLIIDFQKTKRSDGERTRKPTSLTQNQLKTTLKKNRHGQSQTSINRS